jgi:long-subunit acyl-CoA synthetase (AMP-forming)
VVQPNFDALLKFVGDEGIHYDDAEVETDGDETVAVPGDLIDHPDVQALFESEVESVNEDLADYQMIQKFSLLERALSVDAGELTPTLKKRRRDILENFSDRIEGMYESD